MLQLLQLQFVNQNVDKMLTAATDSFQTSVCVIQIPLEIHTKFVGQWREIHVQTQNAALEPIADKRMVALNVSVQSVIPAIHLLNAEIWTNVWKILAERIQFVLIRPAATIASVNVDSSEIHLQCAHQFRAISNVMIQTGVLVAKRLLVQPDIDVKVANV